MEGFEQWWCVLFEAKKQKSDLNMEQGNSTLDLINMIIYRSHAVRKGAFWAYADSEGPDQTARLRSLIWAFAARLLNQSPL